MVILRPVTDDLPEPWRRVASDIIGGLTNVGFAHADGQELLLVVSWNGRGVFDLDGNRIARDPTGLDDTWHDEDTMTAIGIGPLEGERVPIAGLWGGTLPSSTADGWTVRRDGERVLLLRDDIEPAVLQDEDFFDFRVAGFSPTGRALVIATGGDFTLLVRS